MELSSLLSVRRLLLAVKCCIFTPYLSFVVYSCIKDEVN